MAKRTVKLKFTVSGVLTVLAAGTFLASAASIFPESWVEQVFSRTIFPTISHIVGPLVDKIPFSLLDVVLPAGIGLLVWAAARRRWGFALGLVASFYLWFFWTWGLHYHRVPLENQLPVHVSAVAAPDVNRFAQTAAAALNRLHGGGPARLPAEISQIAAARVRRVLTRLNAGDFVAASVIKRSWLAEGWFHLAGIQGVFNPFGFEPLVTSDLLHFELPFVMSHELAHVRGIAHEGEANLVAMLATVASDDPAFQYSGWLGLWPYLQNRERNKLLDPGPVADLEAIYERARLQQAAWAIQIQTSVLDFHLKTHDVTEGVRSYSRIIELAIATEDSWEEFR